MSPPELTGNTPVTDVLQPVQIRLVKTLRNEGQVTVLDRFDSRFCHLFHLYEPLLLDHRLYRRTTAVMSTYIVYMLFYFYKQSLCFQIRYHCFSCLVTVHTIIFAARAVNGRIIVHDVDLWQIVASSYLKVIRVMGRRNLYASGSKLFIYVRIRNYRNLAVCERQFQHLANQIRISFIIRIHSHSGIAK